MSKEIFIIGGGESLKDFDTSKLDNKDVMVVNNGILLFPNAKYFVTMDYVFKKKTDKMIWKKFTGTKFFIVNLVPSWMEEKEGQIVDTRFNLVYDLKSFDVIIKSKERGGFGRNWNEFRTGRNSGYAGIQLSLLLGYQTINLLGFDLQAKAQTHFHGYYNKNVEQYNQVLAGYYEFFKKGIRDLQDNWDVEIYSCSKESRLNKFLTYKEI